MCIRQPRIQRENRGFDPKPHNEQSQDDEQMNGVDRRNSTRDVGHVQRAKQPIHKGNGYQNERRADRALHQVLEAGFCPFPIPVIGGQRV